MLLLALAGETDAELTVAAHAAAGKLHGWSGTLETKQTYSNPNGPLSTWEETATVEVNDKHVTYETDSDWRQEELKFTIVGKATGPGSCPHPDGTSTPFTWTQTTYETGVTAAQIHLAERGGGGDTVGTDYFGGNPVVKESDSCPTADGGWGYGATSVSWADLDGGGLERSHLAGINHNPGGDTGSGERSDSRSTVSLSRKPDRVTLTVVTSHAPRVDVRSSPGGIDCRPTCSHVYKRGTTVYVDATPQWGACPNQNLIFSRLDLLGVGTGPLVCEPAVTLTGGGCKPLTLGRGQPPACAVTLTKSETVQVRASWLIGRPRLARGSKAWVLNLLNVLYDGIANGGFSPALPDRTARDLARGLAKDLEQLALDPPNRQFRRFPHAPRLAPLDLSAVPVSPTARKRLGALGHAMQRAGDYVRLVRTSIERAEGARIARKPKFERRQMAAAAKWARHEADASLAVNRLRRRVLEAIDSIPPDALAAEVPARLTGTAATLEDQKLTRGLRGFAKRMRKFAHFAAAHPFQTAPGWKRYAWKK